MKEKILKELQFSRSAGQFLNSPVDNLRISPIDLALQSDAGWRLITHVSHPAGESVNGGISDELGSVSCISIDQVVDKIFKIGLNADMAKRDIKSAFSQFRQAIII